MIPLIVPIAVPVNAVIVFVLILFAFTVQTEVDVKFIPLNVHAAAPPAIVLPLIVFPFIVATNDTDECEDEIPNIEPVEDFVLLVIMLLLQDNVDVNGDPDNAIPVKVPVPASEFAVIVLPLTVTFELVPASPQVIPLNVAVVAAPNAQF